MSEEVKPNPFKENRAFWHKPLTVVLSAILLFFAAQLIGSFLVAPFLPYLATQNLKLLAFIATNTIVLFGLIAIAMRVIGFKWRAVGLKLPKLKQFALVVPAFVVYLLISIALTALIQLLVPSFNVEQAQDIGFAKAGSNLQLIAAFMSLVVLTPLFEEVIFRGVLFRGLRRKLPFWAGAVLTSIIFAVAHGQWNVAIDTFALSLILCFLVEKSDSILPAIFLHALKNSLAFTLLFLVKW